MPWRYRTTLPTYPQPAVIVLTILNLGHFLVPLLGVPLEKNPFLLSSKGDYTPQNLQIEEISRSLPLGVP